MVDNVNVLHKNELEANRFAAKITLTTILFLALVYTLNVVGIFVAPQGPMTIAMCIAAFMMLVPPFLVFVLKCKGTWVKFVIVTACTLMVTSMNVLLSWHVILMFLYPISIASLFFSRSLSWYSVILSTILFTLSQISSLYIGGLTDLNLPELYDMVIYGILPRSLQLIALSLIFIMLSKRTKKLLQNAVSAEEQKLSLERIIALTDKSYEVSNNLVASVKVLSEVTNHAIQSNEEITKKTSSIVNDSQQTIRYVDEAGAIVSNVSSELNSIAKDNIEISKVSKETMILTGSNTENMKDAANEMQRIDKVTKESKAIITRLGEKSNEIANIAEVIRNIATNTNLLSLNASIESARAGEQGKGFAVVAEQIRALAEQSQKAAGNISDLIKTVLEDTSEAVNSMDMNAKIVENGLALISKADLSSEEVTKSITKVNTMAQNIASLSTTVATDGEKISKAVEGISKLTINSLEELKTIQKASEEQLAAMNEVAVSVGSIHTTSDELLKVVNQKID